MPFRLTAFLTGHHDVDLFAEASTQFDFSQAVDTVIAAYRRDGLQADAEVRSSSFARLSVSSGEEGAKVELGVDWRKNMFRLAVGPVLHADDAVANKVCALFGRAEVRDYVDVASILASGRYSEEDLACLAEEHDPGFDPAWFAEALNAVDRLPGQAGPPAAGWLACIRAISAGSDTGTQLMLGWGGEGLEGDPGGRAGGHESLAAAGGQQQRPFVGGQAELGGGTSGDCTPALSSGPARDSVPDRAAQSPPLLCQGTGGGGLSPPHGDTSVVTGSCPAASFALPEALAGLP
jgi:hypothetical protein